MSTEIATTHVGSLPRGPELTPLLLARDHGDPYDADAFDRVVQAAVDAAVAAQVAAGVTVVSDGELGKVGYSTYMIERLSGFGGHTDRKPALDLAPLPDLRAKLAHIMGAQEFTRASCVAEVKLVSLEPLHDDIRRFRTALDRNGKGSRAFLNAASPGLITAFQQNAFYPSHEAYLADLVDAMRPEYEAIVAGGFDLAVRISSRRLSDSQLVAKNVGSLTLGAFAGPSYLSRRGAPKTPRDLSEHDWVAFRGQTQIELVRGTEKSSVEVKSRIHCDDMFFVREALRTGAGIGILPTFVADQEVLRGQLVRVLPRWNAPSGDLWLLYPSARQVPRKVCAFRDFVAAALKQDRGTIIDAQ